MTVLRQVQRFSLVGAIGFLLDAGLLHVLVTIFDINPYVARLISFLFAATGTWFLNRNFTFKDAAQRKINREWSQYLLFNSIGGGINYACFACCLFIFEVARAYPVLGVAIGSAVGLVFNFSASKYIVFGQKHIDAKDAHSVGN